MSGSLWGAAHPMWKGDDASPTNKRGRAQRRYPLQNCESCGAPAMDRHHRDGDPGNNAPENIALLCRRCHMKVDGRLERLKEVRWHPPIKPPKPCDICARLYKPLRRGRCHACDMYLRRTGRERMCA